MRLQARRRKEEEQRQIMQERYEHTPADDARWPMNCDDENCEICNPKSKIKNQKGSASLAKVLVLGVWVAVWLILAANYTTVSIAGLADHKAQLEQMLEVK